MAALLGEGGGTVRGLGDVPGLVSNRSEMGGGQHDDVSSYTGSSYTGTTIEEEEEEEECPGRAALGHGIAPQQGLVTPGGAGESPKLRSPSKKGWLGGFFSTRREDTRRAEQGTEQGEGTARAIEATPQATTKQKKHRRHHKRRYRPSTTAAQANAAMLSSKSTPEGAALNKPSFMMPLFSKIKQRAAEEAAQAASGNPKLDKWRTRWDEKWVEGGRVMLSDRRPPPSHFEANARSSMRSTLGSMSESHMSAPPRDTWGMVRERISDITQMV
uniref:Uncharacterized protein n=1 Tax=Haptolina brevifila TaxID=156173 RepID=A0A7S2CR79_9EUKA